LEWARDAYRDWTLNPSFILAFLTGACVLQEEAAMTPIQALDLKKGQIVLDLCAAPGNKTAQMASKVGWTGQVVANDISTSRMNVLRGLIDRVGLPNVLLTNHDAADFPETGFKYDAVIADVPCSCEGTCRKNPSVLKPQNSEQRTRLSRIQERILRKAIRLAKTGGRIAYATCTFAPEENECVLDRILSSPEAGQQVELERVSLEGFSFDSGLQAWNGERFHPTMSRAVRIWPHSQDTGGFFFGILRKVSGAGSGEQNGRSKPSPDYLATVEAEPVHVLDQPWGFHRPSEKAFANLLTQTTGGKYDRLVVGGDWPEGVNEIVRGMTGLNRKSDQPRLSTSLAQFLGVTATAGIAQIAPEQTVNYFSRRSTPLLSLIPPLGETRFVIVKCGSIPLGLGHIPKADESIVESMFPKNWGGLKVEDWIRNQAR